MLLLLHSVTGCGSYSECLYFCDFRSDTVNQDGCNYRGSQRRWTYIELEITLTWEAGTNSVRHASTQISAVGVVILLIWSNYSIVSGPMVGTYTHKCASYIIMSISKKWNEEDRILYLVQINYGVPSAYSNMNTDGVTNYVTYLRRIYTVYRNWMHIFAMLTFISEPILTGTRKHAWRCPMEQESGLPYLAHITLAQLSRRNGFSAQNETCRDLHSFYTREVKARHHYCSFHYLLLKFPRYTLYPELLIF
jgi:hypothetical protein